MNQAAEKLNLQPGLLRTFLGLWLFELRTRTTLGRLAQSALLVIGMPVLMYVALPGGDDEHFREWLVTFHLLLAVPLGCLATFGPLIRDELQADTLGFLVSRPLHRHRLFLLKYLCAMLWTQLVMLFAGFSYLAVARIKGVAVAADPALLFLLAQALSVLAYGALGGLLGLLSPKYMVLGVVYGFVVEVGLSNIPTNIHVLAVSHHVTAILANHAKFAEQFGWSAAGIVSSSGLIVAMTALFLFFAAVLFSFREYHHGEAMQK
jgi:ABC-type transport system involved in multi-copper enzyme maturation permease subunit